MADTEGETGERNRQDIVCTAEGIVPQPSGKGSPVFLKISGIQTDVDGNRQENTAEYPALFFPWEDGCLFQYTAEKERVMLFLSRGKVRMKKGGSQDTDMVFDPSVPSTRCEYKTPFGTIPMEIRTERIVLMNGGKRSAEMTPSGIRCRVKYILVMEGDYALDCSVTIYGRFPEKDCF